MVSHDEWERGLGGRPLAGLTIWVDERQYEVIGVLPPEMALWEGPPQQAVWIPVPQSREGSAFGSQVVVKLKRDWPYDAVVKQLAMLADRLTREYGSGPVPYSFSLRSVVRDPLGLRPIHYAMAGAVGVVLLIACVNLASLMLVRGAVKRRELALRMAIGAGRATLVRQLLMEGAVIAGVGAIVGLILTVWAVAVLHNQMPPAVRMLGVLRPHASWRVFAAGVGLAGTTLLLFGLWPAVRASDVDVSEPLKENSGSSIGRRHWRYSPLVIAEVALSLVLLMSAALLTRAAERKADWLLGYDRTGLSDAWIWLGPRSRETSAGPVGDNVLASIRALPSVRAAAAFGSRGLLGTAMSEAFDGTNGLLSRTSVVFAGEGFLRTLGIPVLEGRDFLPGDDRDSALIVDEEAARGLWPDGQAVGRLVKLGGPRSNRLWHRVVGVARTAQVQGPPSDPFLQRQGTVYVAWTPSEGRASFALAIRTTRLDAGSAVTLRQGIRDALPPGGRLWWLEPWLSNFDVQVRAQIFLARLAHSARSRCSSRRLGFTASCHTA